MRTAFLALLVALAPALLWSAPADPKPRKTDAELIRGEWTVADAAFDPDEPSPPEEEFKKTLFVFGDDSITVQVAGGRQEPAKYKLDPTAKPKAIDIMPGKPGGAAMTVKGIYELDGDSLRLCFRKNEGERPDKFEAAKGSKAACVTLKRAPAKE